MSEAKALKERILTSALFLSGSEFTMSDMAGRTQETAENVKYVLRLLTEQDLVMVEKRGKTNYYRKHNHIASLLNRKLGNYRPPRSARFTHLNPWVAVEKRYQ